jgi:hypothetical protein
MLIYRLRLWLPRKNSIGKATTMTIFEFLRRLFQPNARDRRRGFVDQYFDKDFGLLQWAGFGDGDYWTATLTHRAGPVQFRIDGFKRPDLQSLERARLCSRP